MEQNEVQKETQLFFDKDGKIEIVFWRSGARKIDYMQKKGGI